MILFEEYSRWLLVLHTVLGVALVASTTHMVIWMRGYLKGRYGKHRGVRRFAWISASLFVITFLFGNAIYPTYKVRVRTQYLESPSAIVEDARARQADRITVIERENQRRSARGEPLLPVPTEVQVETASRAPETTAKIARWFDVKEHWVALGMAMSIGVLFIVMAWDPRKQGSSSRTISRLVFGLALGTAATTWIGAVIGLLVSSYRAVGPLG